MVQMVYLLSPSYIFYFRKVEINADFSFTAVSVGWNTYAPQAKGCVRYGNSPDNLNHEVCSSSNSTTYPSSRTWSSTVVLTGLTPATTYYYQIVSTNSSVEHFFSPRTPGDKTPFSMNVVADLGVYGPDGYTLSSNSSGLLRKDTIPSIDPSLEHATIGALANTVDDYEFIIHPGDFAYADDWYLKPQNLGDGKDAYQAILEQFYDQLAPVTGCKMYMTGPGNHDTDCEEIPFTSGLCPEGQNNFTDFLHRFGGSLPTAFSSSSLDKKAKGLAEQAKSLAVPPFWYSFEYGMVHVVMINTETDYPLAADGPLGVYGLNSGPFGLPGQQIEFLKADLASVDRSVTPWVIVAGHRPWYTTGAEICVPCQAAFEDLFYTYGVDVGIFGHVHNSARFDPIYKGVPDANSMNNPKAPLYLVAGGAGNIEGLSDTRLSPPYTAFAYGADYSYATLKFLDSKRLQVDFIRSSTGLVLDSSVLYKEHSVNFVRQ
ncbi:Hypothetical protein PENO1_009020 [Penicillium occitanis (nom. inval.)]|nr:Hypothetical protein PENO1_009020 [Penicillium occitanis (nom. inval.)]PCH10041.1 hypothetical protein PENOC_005660 [Penicillium occitanis (nom. inval.)]